MRRRPPRSTSTDTLLPCTRLFRSKDKACRATASKRRVAGALGFEPRAFGFGDRRSNQLSYAPTPSPPTDRKCTRLNSRHYYAPRMPPSPLKTKVTADKAPVLSYLLPVLAIRRALQ